MQDSCSKQEKALKMEAMENDWYKKIWTLDIQDLSWVEDTRRQVDFLCMDIREIPFEGEFDVVLSMADGAIGYLENDAENLKIFTAVSKALKPGGKYFMDIMNGSYADQHFPCRLWDAGQKCLTLSAFEWNRETRVMLYGQRDYEYGQPLTRPDIDEGHPIRLYTLAEITDILSSHGMEVFGVYADFDGTVSSDQHIQLLICAEKN